MESYLSTLSNLPFEEHVQASQREYDGKWNVWSRVFNIQDDPTESYWYWETIGVFDTKELAEEYINTL